jgi:polysaccharide export outer membrane protein
MMLDMRRLIRFAAFGLLAMVGVSVALAQQATPNPNPQRAAGPNAPMGTPMGQPLTSSTAGGSGALLQSQVDAGRQPVASDGASVAARLNPPDDGAAPGSNAADVAAKAASGEPQPLNSLASVGTDYRIGANDLVDFDVFGVPNMQRTVRVNASGMVALPLIGPVTLAGLTAAQAENLIAQKYAENYLQDPQVSLFIKEFTTQRITIEGAVARPGIYPVTGQLTLLRALALAGGGAQFAQLNEIMLFRGGSAQEANTQMFDLEKIRNGDIPDPVVNSDDVIVVKRDPKRTALRDSFFGDLLSTLNPFK